MLWMSHRWKRRTAVPCFPKAASVFVPESRCKRTYRLCSWSADPLLPLLCLISGLDHIVTAHPLRGEFTTAPWLWGLGGGEPPAYPCCLQTRPLSDGLTSNSRCLDQTFASFHTSSVKIPPPFTDRQPLITQLCLIFQSDSFDLWTSCRRRSGA